MVCVLAWAYQRYGQLAQARWLLYGVSPVVIAIIGVALGAGVAWLHVHALIGCVKL
jgi:chromate transport protein ChrA